MFLGLGFRVEGERGREGEGGIDYFFFFEKRMRLRVVDFSWMVLVFFQVLGFRLRETEGEVGKTRFGGE